MNNDPNKSLTSDDDDEDYVPESLRMFLKEADEQLVEQKKKILEIDGTDSETSSRRDLVQQMEAELARIKLMDENEEEKKVGTSSLLSSAGGYESDDFLSPVAGNPANHLTYSQVKFAAMEGAQLTPPPEEPMAQTALSPPQHQNPQLDVSAGIRLFMPAGSSQQLTLTKSVDVGDDHSNASIPIEKAGKGYIISETPEKPPPADLVIAITSDKPDLQVELKATMSTDSTAATPMVSVTTPDKDRIGNTQVEATVPTGSDMSRELFSKSFDSIEGGKPAAVDNTASPNAVFRNQRIDALSHKNTNPPTMGAFDLTEAMRGMKLSKKEGECKENHPNGSTNKQMSRIARVALPGAQAWPKPSMKSSSITKKSHFSKVSPRTPPSTTLAVKTKPIPTASSSSPQRSPPTTQIVPPNSRLIKPTAASRTHTTPTGTKNNPQNLTPLPATSRLLQPTALSAQRNSPPRPSPTSTASTSSRPKRTVPTVSSRLTAPTAASKARVEASAAPSLPAKRSPDEAVQRARERVRQRRAAEQAAFSMGSKPAVGAARTAGATKPSIKISAAKNVGFTQAAQFAKRKPKTPTLAHSTLAFSQGLRKSGPPPPISHTKPALTIPEGPKFLARYEAKKKAEEPVPMACMDNVLLKTLRSDAAAVPPAAGKRDGKLTRPQSPKFQRISQRPLPKSAQEMEEEIMDHYKLHPFKARPLASLHSGSSKGINTVNKRRLTTPQPFKLSTEGRGANTRPLEGSPSKDAEDLEECKKQFRATPLPDFSSASPPSKPVAKRPVTTPEPFHFAVDLRTKEPSTKKFSPRRFKAKPLPKSTFSPPPQLTAGNRKKTSPVTIPQAPNLSVSARAESRRAAQDAFERNAENFQQKKQQEAERCKRERHEKMMFRAELSPPVKPEPFHLETDKRHELHQQELERKLKEEEEELQRQMFHALPYHEPKPPMSVKKSSKSPTATEPFHLMSLERHESYTRQLEQTEASDEDEFQDATGNPMDGKALAANRQDVENVGGLIRVASLTQL